MLPPDSDEREDNKYVEILKSLGYLSDDGQEVYWGPPLLPTEGWQWSKKWHWWWHEDLQMKLLRTEPDRAEVATDTGQHVLSRLHWKVLGHDPEHALVSNRDKRRLRMALTAHGYRRFRPWGPTCEDVRCQICF